MATNYNSSIYNYTATITAYDPVTKLVTLDKPVTLSLGTNTFAGGDISSSYSISGNLTKINSAVQSGTRLAKPTSDESGNFVAVFNVPPSKFQTGTRVFRIDNRSIPSDISSGTTWAEASFTASGLSTISQRIDISPSIDSSGQVFTQVNQKSNQLLSTVTTASSSVVVTAIPQPPPAPPFVPPATPIIDVPTVERGGGRGGNGSIDPLAQTFIVSKDNFPNGVFLYSIKLFFQKKPSINIPIKLSIVPTINGYPGGSPLDYSTVILSPDKVKTSANPHYLDQNTYTEFVFESPVYIQANLLYAFLIKSSSVDYYLWYGQQNKPQLPSTAKAKPTDPNPAKPAPIGAAPYVGALFESQNGITWTADQTKDLMFSIEKCLFSTVPAQVQFVVPRGLPFRKMGHQDIINKLDANSTSQLLGNYSQDRVYDAFNITTTDLTPTGTGVNYSYVTTLLAGNVPTEETTVSPGKLGSPMPDDIHLNDGKGQRALLKVSNSSFSLYATMATSDPNVSPVISDDGTSLYAIVYRINDMGIGNNVITITDPGYGYNVNTTTIIVSNPDIGSNVATLQITANTNGAITNVFVTSPGSGYLTTPTVTISDPTTRSGNANAIVTITGETSPKGGNAFAKYFTKKVVLSPGNDSGDLRVFYTAYKPLGSAVYIYYKILNSLDTTPFESGDWQLMTSVGNQSAYSSSRVDLHEYECAPGIFLSNQANNTISYTNSDTGQTYNSFIQFAIKVVFASNDNTSVPFLTDIRALALPPGTGL